MDHTWATEEVDGGPMGVEDFWKCSVCGASGGPAFPNQKPWRPFIAGPAEGVSADCHAAQAEIRAYIQGRIEKLRKKRGTSPKFVQLFEESLKRSPDKTNVMLMKDLLYRVENQPTMRTLEMARTRLIADGFNVPTAGEFMGLYDIFQSKDENLRVQLKNGPCKVNLYREGEDVGDDFKDGVYHSPEGVVVIWNGRILSVTAHVPTTLPADLAHFSKWGHTMTPGQNVNELNPLTEAVSGP